MDPAADASRLGRHGLLGPSRRIGGLKGKTVMAAPASRPRTAIAIRLAIESDCARVADIYNDAIRSGRSTMDTRFVDAAHLQQLLAKCTPREVLLVSESQGRVVGWGIVKRYSERPGYDYACEESVYVADDQQGRGYGSALLEPGLPFWPSRY